MHAEHEKIHARTLMSNIRCFYLYCVRCHGTKCPLLKAFISLSFFFLSPWVTFLLEGVIVGSEMLPGLLTNNNIKMLIKKKWGPPYPPYYDTFEHKRGIFKSLLRIPKLRI